jgi:DNA-binding transcriptional LysR family regulator
MGRAMDMDQISTFVTISRLGSFSRAAQALHRSQPAISRRIELLKDELGAAVFERVNGQIVLTDAGAALLPYAETVLAAARDGLDAVRALQKGDTGRLSIALVGTLANEAFTAMLRRFRRRHPQVEIALQTATSREIGDLVRRGDATIGLRYLVDRSPGLVSQNVTRENLIVVCSASHPLAKRRTLRAEHLANEKWVAFRTGSPRESFVQFLNRTLAAAGIDEPEIVPIDSLTAQKRLVESNFGIALLAESAVADELKRGTLANLSVPALRTSIPVTVIYRRDGYLSPSARAFLSLMTGQPAAAASQAIAALRPGNRQAGGSNRNEPCETAPNPGRRGAQQ